MTKEQSGTLANVEPHVHRCGTCGATFSHDKGLIIPMCQELVHHCPSCGHYCNERLSELAGRGVQVQYPDWYGYRGAGHVQGGVL